MGSNQGSLPISSREFQDLTDKLKAAKINCQPSSPSLERWLEDTTVTDETTEQEQHDLQMQVAPAARKEKRQKEEKMMQEVKATLKEWQNLYLSFGETMHDHPDLDLEVAAECRVAFACIDGQPADLRTSTYAGVRTTYAELCHQLEDIGVPESSTELIPLRGYVVAVETEMGQLKRKLGEVAAVWKKSVNTAS